MKISELTARERNQILECLKCAARGHVIKHDSEFQTVFGITVEELKEVISEWPDVADGDTVVELAVNNSLNNLLGYPHGFHDDWDRHIPVSREEVQRLFARWRGAPVNGYFEGVM